MSETNKIVAMVAAGAAVIAALVVWATTEMNAWEARCTDAGGQVVQEYIGDTQVPVMDGKGNVTGYIDVPNYAYRCMVDGREVEV